jgi:hypothetical protein
MINIREEPTLPNIDARIGIVEVYSNTLYEGHECKRYWVPGFPILIGGSILSTEDWNHLQSDFGITDVINVETEHDDTGKLPEENLLQVRVPDNGNPFPVDKITTACTYWITKSNSIDKGHSRALYVHCQMGGSRSPAFAYAILRSSYKLNSADALDVIRSCPGKEAYGNHVYHTTYLSSIDAALESFTVGA